MSENPEDILRLAPKPAEAQRSDANVGHVFWAKGYLRVKNHPIKIKFFSDRKGTRRLLEIELFFANSSITMRTEGGNLRIEMSTYNAGFELRVEFGKKAFALEGKGLRRSELPRGALLKDPPVFAKVSIRKLQ